MAETTATNLTFVAVELRPTRGNPPKDRWIARTNDGREIGIWDSALAQAVQAHLHEDLLCEVSTRELNGNWYTNLVSIPALGISQAPKQNGGGGGGGTPMGQAVDLSGIQSAIERIALTLDNLLAFATEVYLKDAAGKAGVVPGDDFPEP